MRKIPAMVGSPQNSKTDTFPIFFDTAKYTIRQLAKVVFCAKDAYPAFYDYYNSNFLRLVLPDGDDGVLL